MKITRRRQPTDFGASNDDALADPPAATADETEEALELTLALPSADVAAAPAAPQAPGRPAPEPPAAWPLYLGAFAVAVLWSLGPLAFALGYRSGVAPLTDARFALAVLGLLAVGPAAFVFALAYFIRQGQLLAWQTRRAQALEAELVSPALRATGAAEEVTRAVREQIAAAAAAADQARDSLTALRGSIAAEVDGLTRAAQDSLGQARQLGGELGRERGELEAIGRNLEAQALRAAELVDQQAERVAQASQAAESTLRDAEALLAGRTEALAVASGEAANAARTSAEDLARHIARLESAGLGVAEQVRAAEGGLSEQRAALATLAQALREDHQGFSTEADAHAVRLDDFIGQVRRAASEMSERATIAGENLRGLIGEANARFDELADMVVREQDALKTAAARSLGDLGRAATDERTRMRAEQAEAIGALREAAEATREAAARHAEAAREQVDQLSEAAFAAGQKANQVFEARLEEARALVDQSSRLVAEAGAAAALKLDEGAAAARDTLAELGAMVEALEARASVLPEEARARAEAVRAQVAHGMDALMAHARRTAQEAQAIDAAFQERVRKNFEMLSEAVRLMGTVAAAPSSPPAAPPAEPDTALSAPSMGPDRLSLATPYPVPDMHIGPLTVEPSPVAPPPTEPPVAEPPVAEPPVAAGAEAPAPAAATPDGAALAERLGLRPRIKLTPTRRDQAFSALFEAAGPPRAGPAADAEPADDDEPAETWTWKDLLASLNGPDGAGEAEEESLAAELRGMGVEPETLLPADRIRQIAAARGEGDLDGARQAVKRLAGAASRRLVRRLFTDQDLKARAEGFVGRYHAVLEDAARGAQLAEALSGEGGRVFLLLDQALADRPADEGR
jgi:hypothetical protein